MVRARILQAVRLEKIFRRPFIAAIVVVQIEEGSSVEGGYMVLLCLSLARSTNK
jgi:hypothetical protein